MTVLEYINRWGEVTLHEVLNAVNCDEGILQVLEIKGLIKSSLGKIYIANSLKT